MEHGPNPFTARAIDMIARSSEGLSRRINILADKALLAAYSSGSHQVDAGEVKIAEQDARFAPIQQKTANHLAPLLKLALALLLTAALATSVGEAARHLAEKGLTSEGAPALVRLITLVATRYKVQLTQKAAGMLVPGIGAAAGAGLNLMFMDHFQDVSRGHFIVRRLERCHGAEAVHTAWQSIDLKRSR